MVILNEKNDTFSDNQHTPLYSKKSICPQNKKANTKWMSLVLFTISALPCGGVGPGPVSSSQWVLS